MLHTLKSKILLIYTFLIALICFIAVISVLNLYNLNRAIDGLIESNYTSIVAATNMIMAIERQDSNQLIYLQVNEEKGLRTFTDNEKEFFNWFSKAMSNITENNEPEVLESISENYTRYLEAFSKLQKIKVADEKKALRYYDEEIYPIVLEVKDSCMELSNLNEQAMFSSKNKATINSQNQMYTTIIVSIFLISLGFIVAFYFTKKVMAPLNMLTEGVKSIKHGNWDQEIKVFTRDEVGQLASEFNNMTKRLLKYEQSNIKNIINEKNKSIAIVKSISDPLIVTDNKFKISLVNNAAEKIFNINEQNVINKHILEVVENREIYLEIEAIINGNEKTKNREDNFITLNKNNKKYYYILTVNSILNDDQQIIGTVSVLQDITHMKKVEQLKSDFISTVSHELRTPLTSIVMGSDLLLEEVAGKINTDQQKIISAINEDSNRLMTIVNDLLDLTKIEAGKIIINRKKLSIYNIVEECIKGLKDKANHKGIKLYHTIKPDIPYIYADLIKTNYILNNLIDNALKFTNNGGEVKVSAVSQNKYIKITVQDNGIGIPEEFQQIIFNKFTQVWDMQDNDVGSGLGLAITSEFIKRQEGEIWVESEPDIGSKFIFTIPKYIE